MKLNPVFIILFLLVLSIHNIAVAKDEIPVRANIFYGLMSINPEAVNKEIDSLGFEKFKFANYLGLELSSKFAKYFQPALRYSLKMKTIDDGSDFAEIYQYTISLLFRIPLEDTDLLKYDFFAGIGTQGTVFELKSDTVTGELRNKTDRTDFNYLLGASASYGYKKVFLNLEVGYEKSHAKRLDRIGNISEDIYEVDLSGPYIFFGVMLDKIFTGKL